MDRPSPLPALVSSDGRIIYTYQFWPDGIGGNKPGLAMGSRPGDDLYWPAGKGEPSRHRIGLFEWSPAADVQLTGWIIIIPIPTIFVASVPHWLLFLLAAPAPDSPASRPLATPPPQRRPLPLLQLRPPRHS